LLKNNLLKNNLLKNNLLKNNLQRYSMPYDRDPLYLHPKLQRGLPTILAAITPHLPAGHTCKMISAHRTPADQFELYRKGRTFRGGRWVRTGAVVTHKDGYTTLSRHNYVPCLALDIGIFDPWGRYVTGAAIYLHVKFGAKSVGCGWGGDWTSFQDRPHIEIPTSKLFMGSRAKDAALQWQRYLKTAGAYEGALDGIFGTRSRAALREATGSTERSTVTWKKLFTVHGTLP
jgi:peptidoglycan L-alanyl-D-glutamate endopeptidase CwlK